MKNIIGEMLVATMLLASSTTFAQEPAQAPPAEVKSAPTPSVTPVAPTDPPKTEASRFLEEGIEALKANDSKLAQARFTQAIELDPTPFAIMQLGRAELNLGNAADAAKHFEYYLLENSLLDGKSRDMQVEEAVRKLFEEAKSKCATVKLIVDPAEVKVYVDGKPIDDKPFSWRLYLPPLTHDFVAKKTGFADAMKQVDLVAGRQVDVELKLVPVPNAQIIRETTDRTDKRWIKSNAGVAIGLGVLGIGAAIGTVAASPTADERKSLSDDDYNRRQVIKGGLAYASIASFVGAAAVGGVTLAYVFGGTKGSSDSKTPPKAAIRFVPTLNGVVVQGHWF